MTHILLTGSRGQIGWELKRTLATLGRVFSYDKETLDLADPSRIKALIREIKPQVIVNAGAYTAVDVAEKEEALSLAINGTAPGVFAEEAKKINALLVHYSTDYVFDGSSKTPYREENSSSPINAYGRTKLQGEKNILSVGGSHLILRTAWVYGLRGKNFLLTMLRLAKERRELKIVNDQMGTPNWSRMLAEATAQMILQVINATEKDLSGIYHLSSSGQTTWAEFAEAIFDEYQKLQPAFSKPSIIKIPSSDYPTPAIRPKYSVLCNEKTMKTFKLHMPDWKEALKLCLEA